MGGSTTPWPTISESQAFEHNGLGDRKDMNEDWEILCVEEDESALASAPVTSHRILKHCESSPNFGSFYFEEEETEESPNFVELENENDTKSVSTAMTDLSHVVVETPVITSPNISNPNTIGGGLVKVHRVPSFKDAILLNAQEVQKERLEVQKQQEEATLNSMKQKRRMGKTRFVVKEIKRCSKSTPDLSSLAQVVEDEQLGATDSPDYYARKSFGYVARKNGLKLRPDEAKRKEFSIYKRDAQRMQTKQGR